MDYSLGAAGYCTGYAPLLYRGASSQTLEFPALFAVFHHPREGVVLFDTGYSTRFFEATEGFPERFYRWATPVYFSEENSAAHQLQGLGISASSVKTIIVSHFHADHVAGLSDFPQARLVFHGEALRVSRGYGRWRSVRAAFLRSLVPDDIDGRSAALEEGEPRWRTGLYWTGHWDLFGDDSFHILPLPGHAPGQCGLLAQTKDGPLLLGADCAWTAEEALGGLALTPIARGIQHDYPAYLATQLSLQTYLAGHPEVGFLPSHCAPSLRARGVTWA